MTCLTSSRFLELSTCLDSNTTMTPVTVMEYFDLEVGDELVVCPLEIREDPGYIRDYILLANFLVMVLLPGVLLVFTNARIYRQGTYSVI